jgi:hypothetical protein
MNFFGRTRAALGALMLLPAMGQAQELAAEEAFTRHALLTGFLVLTIIVLVFLSLLLAARVNELRGTLRKKEHPPASPRVSRHQVVNLDEDQIEWLIGERKKRQGHAVGSKVS